MIKIFKSYKLCALCYILILIDFIIPKQDFYTELNLVLISALIIISLIPLYLNEIFEKGDYPYGKDEH